jgi:GNAT superfamily N-acetyltransferase
MLIRDAHPADFPAVVALLQQLNPTDPTELAPVQHAFNTILHADNLRLLVAEQDGKIVASCYLNVIPNMTRGAKPYAIIENVITDSQHRQQGIGKLLITHAAELAWAAHCYKIVLTTSRKDPAVHAFYQRCGFAGDDKTAYVMRAP